MNTTTPTRAATTRSLDKFEDFPPITPDQAIAEMSEAGAFGVQHDGADQARRWHDTMIDLLTQATTLSQRMMDAWAELPMGSPASEILFDAMGAFDDYLEGTTTQEPATITEAPTKADRLRRTLRDLLAACFDPLDDFDPDHYKVPATAIATARRRLERDA